MSALSKDDGQMTIGLAIALPVMLAVALVSYNALFFFSECARFDRIARNAVRICAVSPAYGQDMQRRAASVESMIDEALASEELSCFVTVGASAGLECYEATLEYHPTLFGASLRGSVFGVELFTLRHVTSLKVSSYDAGVIA